MNNQTLLALFPVIRTSNTFPSTSLQLLIYFFEIITEIKTTIQAGTASSCMILLILFFHSYLLPSPFSQNSLYFWTVGRPKSEDQKVINLLCVIVIYVQFRDSLHGPN